MDISIPVPLREIRRAFTYAVNPHRFLVELRYIDVINKPEFDRLHVLPETVLSNLLFEMVMKRKLNASALMYILTKIDRSALLFNSLQRYFHQSECNVAIIARISRINAGIKSEVRFFFNDVKTNFLNASGPFKAPLMVLQTEQNKLETRLQLAKHQTRRTMFIDKKIALLANVIDACLVMFGYTEHIDKLFTDLASLIRHSTNSDLSNVVLYSRKALLKDIHYYVYDQKFDDNGMPLTDGEYMLTTAHMYASSLTPSLEMSNLFFIHLLHELWRFELDPTQEIKQSLLHLGQITLDCLNQENDEFIHTIWGSLVYLKCASCLLGIGNNLRIIQQYIPDHHDINNATQYLLMFQKCHTKLNNNRRLDMWYHLAEARLHDLSGKLSDAYSFVKEAYGIAMQGNFREIGGVKSFYKEIEKAYKDENSKYESSSGSRCAGAFYKKALCSTKSSIDTNYTIDDESLFNCFNSSLFLTSETSPGQNNENEDDVIDTCKDEELFASGSGNVLQEEDESTVKELHTRSDPDGCSNNN